MPEGGAGVSALAAVDERARMLVSGLHTPNPLIFWADLLITGVIAWAAFFLASHNSTPAVLTIVLALFASLAFYRALCFLHEISHLRPNSIRGFETVWNWFIGVPLLMPSFVYIGVHQDHHKTSTYGTIQDPEYMPFATSRVMIVASVLQALLIPAMLLIRFLALSPLAMLAPPLQRVLVEHASALCLNVAYRRTASDRLMRKVRFWQLAMLLVWGAAFVSAGFGWISSKALFVWYGCMAITAVVNMIRTLGAHRYEVTSGPVGRFDQLMDSIDTPGGFWTELWAPVGLRYHALHHYFPGIPYHNLPSAYRRIAAACSPYTKVSSPSLASSLRNLYRVAGGTGPGQSDQGDSQKRVAAG